MTERPRLALFVFDLAGTTVCDDDHVVQSFVRAAAVHGLAVAPAALRTCMGMHKQQVFTELLAAAGRPIDGAAAMAQQFQREFAALAQERPLQPTRGAGAAIAALREAGVQVAFSTGFARATADLVLGAMGWSEFPSIASDEVAHGRPAPDLIQRMMAMCGVQEPARVGVAGDTPADLQAGSAAGCRFVVGVGTGKHTLVELGRHAHTHLLADLTALPALVLGS